DSGLGEAEAGLGTGDRGPGEPGLSFICTVPDFSPLPLAGEGGRRPGEGGATDEALGRNDSFEASIIASIFFGSTRVASGVKALIRTPSSGVRASPKCETVPPRNANARCAIAGTTGDNQIVNRRK